MRRFKALKEAGEILRSRTQSMTPSGTCWDSWGLDEDSMGFQTDEPNRNQTAVQGLALPVIPHAE